MITSPMVHHRITALSLTVDSSFANSFRQVLFWLTLSLALIGVALVMRCIVRGHAVRDLRSLWLGIALLGLAVTLWIGTRMLPPPADTSASTARTMAPTPPAVQALIAQHCYACHASRNGLMSASWTVRLDQPGAVDRLASKIYRQVVQLRAMPMGNTTHMTEQERQVIARWYQARPHLPGHSSHAR